MQAIFDRENRLGKMGSVENKDTNKRLSGVEKQLNFIKKFLIGLVRSVLFGCTAA
jgi:hypothetical protein